MKLITLENLKSFWKDVKSYVDNGLSKKADSVHGTHVTYGTINGKAPGTPSAGTSSKVAREDHVHPVQTTISGNAGTATKLQTARTITLKGRANGSASFDGSGNIIIDTNPKMFESGGTSGTSGYVAVAQLKITGSYANRPTEFKLVSRGRGTACTVSVAFANVDSTDPALSSIRYWGSDYGVFIHKSATSTWLLYATKSEGYDSITVVDCCYGSQGITITYPGSFITEKPTSNITNASLGGSFGQANTANSATKATQDSAGQQINTTYIKGLSVNGKTITYTKGDGSTGTITTQDTNTDTNTTYTLSKSGSTITLTGSDGKTTSVSDSNTTYSTGTTSASGLTKLYTATGTATDGTLTQKAITDALKGKSDTTHTHNYAGSSSAGGAANSANTLATARTINGTSFNGSANITTANWGTARTLTIGKTGKSVNGSGNVSWSTSEILGQGTITTGDWNSANTMGVYEVSEFSGSNGPTGAYKWGGLLTLRHGHVQNQVYLSHSNNEMWIRGGWNGTWNGSWSRVYTSTHPQTTITGNAGTATKLQTPRTINGTSFDGSANITTANWGTARTLTIGNSSKSVNGSGNISWSLSEIGAASSSHSHSYLPLSGGTITGEVTMSKSSGNTYFIAKRTDTGVGVRLGVGEGGANHGVWSEKLNKWIMYSDGSKVILDGNASTATKATQDSAGQQINTTYIKGLSVSGKTITYTKGDGTTGTITTQDTNTTYSTGTASALGLTKLYTGTGTATDGTMTQAAIKTALDGKAASSHSHNYVPTSDYSLTTISKTLTLTTSWQDTGITGSNLSTGTYIVQVSGMSAEATSFYQEIWSGTMSWFQGTTNSTDSDEIILHKAGHASNGKTIYLRTIRTSNSGYLKLQIASSHALSSSNITFKFRKLI